MKADLWLLAALYFSAVEAAVSSNYTKSILSSGTGTSLTQLTVNTSAKVDFSQAWKLATCIRQGIGVCRVPFYSGEDLYHHRRKRRQCFINPYTRFLVESYQLLFRHRLACSNRHGQSWDKEAITQQGQALGSEFKDKGVNVAYAPTVQPLGRSPWGGRNGETYGPDSYISGILGGALTKGMVSSGVIPGAKHFILNEQETNRQGSTSGGGMGGGMGGSAGGNSTNGAPNGTPPSNSRRQEAGNDTTSDTGNSTTSSSSSEAYSAVIGDKALHETYLFPFYDTIKHGVGAVMCSMNRINGTYGCENQETISKLLKAEMGFPGFVSPDAGGQKTSIDSANAGLDYGSESFWSNTTLLAGIANGTFTGVRLNDMVIRNVMGYFVQNQDVSYPSHAGYTDRVDVRKNHGELARKYAADSIVLLRNKDNALPLKNKQAISIFGYHAAPRNVGPNTALTVQSGVADTMVGHMTQNGGSAMSSNAFLITPFQAFNERAEKDGFMLKWWLNNTVVSSSGGGAMVSDGAGTEISETTLGIAANTDACIVFINAWASEGGDRSALANAEADYLVNTVADNCNNTIVVVNTPGPRLLTQFDSHDNVTAILYGGPLGQSSGHAINDVLFGDINPSGKLVHTLAKNESDYDSNTRISEESEIDFSEGNYIDYKYFDQQNKTVGYEFGFGLSYTTFIYGSTLNVSTEASRLSLTYATGDLAVGGREDLWDTVASVSATVTNSGNVVGAEVAQLYVEFPVAADEPIRQLRGFEKLTIQPGSSEQVGFILRRCDLSVWDTVAQEWAIVRGEYKFHVGASSRDLKVSTAITV